MSAASTTAWFKNEVSLASYLPYAGHITPEIVRLDGGALFFVLKVAGVTAETAGDEQLVIWHEALHNALTAIGAPDVFIWRTTYHYRISDFAPGTFEPGFANDLNEAYKARCAKEELFANDLYISVGILGPEKLDKLFKKKKDAEGANEGLEERIERVNSLKDRLIASLAVYRPSALSLYRERDVVFSEVYSFLALIANGKTSKVPLTPHRAGDIIARSRHTFGVNAFVRDFATERQFGAILSTTTYPNHTYAGNLNKTLNLPFPYLMTNSFTFMGKQAADQAVILQAKRMEASGDAAKDEIEAFESLRAELQANNVSLGRHELHMMVLADTREELSKRLSQAEENLMDCGHVAAREDSALLPAYLSQFPGILKWRPRPAPITSRNFAGLSSFHGHPMGRRDGNQWGPATTMFLTEAGTPFFASFHDMRKSRTKAGTEATDDKAPGNTLILGPTGAGKTTVQTFMVAQQDKNKPTVFTFDKSRGQEIFVRAMGGKYSVLKTGQPTGFNFLKLDPAEHLAFAIEMTLLLAAGEDRLSPDEQKSIVERTRFVMTEETYELRTLTHLVNGLDQRANSTIRMRQWTEGPHAWAFHGGDDVIDFSKGRHFGFDNTDFMDNPVVSGPLVKYLFHRVDSHLGKTPSIINIDELKSFLRYPFFRPWIDAKLLLLRKLDSLAFLGTQMASQILESELASTLVEQTVSKLLLPNPNAKYSEYVDGLGLTDAEFELLKVELPQSNPRGFLFKQPGVSAVCNLNLAGMNRHLNVLSGTDTLIARCERARREANSDYPDDWLPIFYQMTAAG
ncbi:type IV secretion system protein VirB4 [Stenotrophomonas sp. PvP093]|uniref:VirB4 family type IV secretion/conjugal transfer ATPase n=1 Tax=unclassified Stenotrophomonas TaxID=196198 RepID=UPI001AE79A22|nr:hypothetical protein [Stenotrophomonas sp. PvP093]MBP2480141.1 type IV secretion system protein VirB4 [Stenotrophomonas sp. PvP093]